MKDIAKTIEKILLTPFFPQELNAKENYFRTHDDCDGEMYKGISVGFTEDGDAWLNACPEGCRFRTYFGGGRSLRVRNALIVLAMAIKLDNEEHPIK